jgi:hypothetical protein
MQLILECGGCGGAVVYDAQREGSVCVFCGSVSLERQSLDEATPVPDSIIPIQVDRERAQGEYSAWARSSWWHPEELRGLRVELQLLLLPAWRFEGDVESHWNGLESGYGPSGKQPVGGRDETRLVHMIPASQGISPAELSALEPFDVEEATAWVEVAQGAPYELPGITETAARAQIHGLMTHSHINMIAASHGLLSCVASSLIQNEEVDLVVLPVYIGAYRFRDRPWRFVVNAQTGEVVGNAPIDRMKVLGVTVGTILAMLLLGLFASELL